MSDLHVLGGVADHIIARLPSKFDINNCKPMADGQPDPLVNKLFAAVHTLNVQGLRQHDKVQEELWSFSVTISKKIHARPIDRVSANVFLSLFASSGLAEIVEYVKYSIQGSDNCVKRMNNKVSIIGAEPAAIIEGITYRQVPQLLNRNPKPNFRNEEWFHGTHSPPRDGQDGFVGLSLTLDFGDVLKATTITEDSCI